MSEDKKILQEILSKVTNIEKQVKKTEKIPLQGDIQKLNQELNQHRKLLDEKEKRI